jgi:hypothetical protein
MNLSFATKRERIRAFLKKAKFSKFEKTPEPQAIAYEQFCESPFYEKTDYNYFARIYNLEKSQAQIKK